MDVDLHRTQKKRIHSSRGIRNRDFSVRIVHAIKTETEHLYRQLILKSRPHHSVLSRGFEPGTFRIRSLRNVKTSPPSTGFFSY